jgi:mycoredoxin-dependent peroxiredoxin
MPASGSQPPRAEVYNPTSHLGGVVRGVSSEHPNAVLEAGDAAPDFDLPALVGGVKKRFHLGDELGHGNVVLAFYPFNWESVSARQMVGYRSERERLVASNANVVGVCVDSIMNTTEWEREIGPFDFPLCSDFWPHGEVSRSYGVLREGEPHAGASDRTVFVIDRVGRITFRKRYGLDELPPISDALQALHAL